MIRRETQRVNHRRRLSDNWCMADISKEIRASGHLIDSGLMRRIFDTIISDGGSFEILQFDIGRTNEEPTVARLSVQTDSVEAMNTILLKLSALGCRVSRDEEAVVAPAPADGVVPADFYSTTNHQTLIRRHGEWVEVDRIRMDGVIVVANGGATVKKFREIMKGDLVVTGLTGIKVQPQFAERSRDEFGFMSGEVSSERKVRLAVDRVADLMQDHSRKVAAVAGPVVVHTGGAPELARLIRSGHIHRLLAGNALAVHDIENALYGTSLGTDLTTGKPVEMGHRNHLRAINEVRRAGSIAALIGEGLVGSGVMYETVHAGIPLSLAGSLRDDGPLPETITDMNAAQDDYARMIRNVDIVLMLSSMLHSIAVGNMLPARVLTVCVDINPAVVTKLKDRGSLQTIGVVTDVGLFLHLLAERLCR